jgi:hypothetical protein
MKLKFTGGNWKVGNYGWCVVTDDKDAIDLEKRDTVESISYYGGALICESCRTNDTSIIAASKDLYEALQILIGDIERDPQPFTKQEKINIARKAIKKANGE